MTLRVPEYPDEQLRAMAPLDRHELWKRALSLVERMPQAKTLADRIEALGLPYSDPKCLKFDDPLTIRIYELVFSSEGKQAALDAAKAGLPPLAGIEPILIAELGADYGAEKTSTAAASAFVAEMMRSVGYEKTGKSGKLPAGCRAKTAALFAPRADAARSAA